jgi:hypothetical protein
MRRAPRKDANHAEVVAALRAAGVWVCDTAGVGNGFPDLLVWARGRFHLLEVKDGRKPASQRKLTPDEVAWIRNCPGVVHVVCCAEDALRAVGLNVEAA